jgi:ABC-type transport system substrate-binding protein
VRQALNLCPDRQAKLDLTYFGLGDVGIEANTAPVHPAYSPHPIPKSDPERAISLF